MLHQQASQRRTAGEVGERSGMARRQLRVLKAASRSSSVAGSVHHVDVVDGAVALTAGSTAGRLARGLAAVRQDLGHTQAQLASAAGVTPSAICQVESGSRGLSVDTLIAIADQARRDARRVGQCPALRRLPTGPPRPATHPAARGVIPLADDAAVGLRAYLVVLDGGDRGVPPVAHTGVQLVAVVRSLVQVEAGQDRPCCVPATRCSPRRSRCAAGATCGPTRRCSTGSCATGAAARRPRATAGLKCRAGDGEASYV